MVVAVLLVREGFSAEKRRNEVEERCVASLKARAQRDFRRRKYGSTRSHGERRGERGGRKVFIVISIKK
jgi:hypothetical protein